MPDLAVSERAEAADYLAELVREYFRDGSSDIRLVISDVPEEQWEKIQGQIVRRFPEGDVKLERVCIGISVEYVPRR